MTSGAWDRRTFLKTVAATGVALQGRQLFAAGPAATRRFKVALIGCGGRGNGALKNMREAAKVAGAEIECIACADAFKEKAEKTGASFGAPADRCFHGYDAYRKVLELPVDIVLLATPPNFRPVHFEAAVAAGKHCFIEKPVAVDPAGARRVMAAAEAAEKKGLTVVAGTQRRHTESYLRNQNAVREGVIGRILGGEVSWCGGRLWFKTREAGESDASYMVRNWTSFTEMSGDHIVEQHVHNLDVANWFIGRTPIAAIGFGGRARRQTGDQFDFFSVDYDYGAGCHIHSMCRQVDGCYGRVGEFFTGTAGTVYGGGKLELFAGQPPALKAFPTHANGQVQEHIDLLNSLIQGKPLNGARTVAESTLTAIMGRISAYTGQMVRWSDLTTQADSPWYNLKLAPAADDFEKGPVVAPRDNVAAVPGKA